MGGQTGAGDWKWKLFKSKFSLDQLVKSVAAALLWKATSNSNHACPENCQVVWIMKRLYFVRSKPLVGWTKHITNWKKIVKASVQVKISWISTCWHLEAVRALSFCLERSAVPGTSPGDSWKAYLSSPQSGPLLPLLLALPESDFLSVICWFGWIFFFSEMTHCQGCKKQKYLTFGWF